MAVQYQVNINLMAGVDFAQEFYLTNPDMTPMDITGAKFAAVLQKDPHSVDAVMSTAEAPVVPQFIFNTRVVSGIGGIFAITASADRTKSLREGKYVYNVTMKGRNGFITSAVGGLAFVDKAFSTLIFDGGLAPEPMADEEIISGGGAAG